MTRAIAGCAALATIATAAPAFSDPLDEAREKFAEARKYEDAGDWARALGLLQQVAIVKMTPQIRFHVALSLEHVGLLTQALDGFARAAEEATPSAPDVVQEARDHVRDLEKRIATVTVVTSGAQPNDELDLDRRPIPQGDPPLPVRVDPGTHVVEVRRRNAVVAREYFVADPLKPKHVELRVGTVAPQVDSDGAPVPTGPSQPPPPPVDATAPAGSSQRTAGFALLGLGGLSAVMTGVFIGMRGGAKSDLDALCPNDPTCPATVDRTTVDTIVTRGKTYAALVDVFAGTTAAALLGGAALIVTAPQAARTGRTMSIVPLVSSTTGGVALRGLL